MASNTSVTDPEALANVTPVTQDTKPEPQQTSHAPAPKQELTATQVDDKPDDLVDFADFEAVKNGIKLDKKPAEVKVDDKKVDAIVAKPDDKTPDVKVEPKVDAAKVEDKSKLPDDKEDKRVYDDIPESLRPVFKKLHNEPFNTFKPIIKENAELKAKLQESEAKYTEVKKGALPDNYYEHQRGYILSPEFESAANTAIRAEQVANHWKGQLEAIRKGEPTYQEVIINPRTGELSLSKPINVDKQAETEVASYVDFSQQQLMEKQFAVRSISERHASTHQEAVSQVLGFEKTAFKVYDGENAKLWEPVIKDTIAKTFPPAFRNNPLATGYAKALITIGKLGEQIKTLKEGAPAVTKTDDGKVISAEDKKKAGPSASDMANAGAGGGAKDDDEVTMDDFKAIKDRNSVYIRK